MDQLFDVNRVVDIEALSPTGSHVVILEGGKMLLNFESATLKAKQFFHECSI